MPTRTMLGNATQDLNEFCGGDGLWGPWSRVESEHINPTWHFNFDFTTCFQDVVFSSAPAAYLLIVGTLRLIALCYHKSIRTKLNSLYVAKLVVNFALALLAVAYLAQAVHHQRTPSGREYYRHISYGAGIQLFAYMFALGLLVFEHKRGHRSSATLTIMWFIMSVVNGIRLRTYILQYNHTPSQKDYDWLNFALFIPKITLDIIAMFMSGFQEPRPSLYDAEHECPEEQAPLLSRISFWWLNPLMILGFKQPLRDENLWNLPLDDQADVLSQTFNDKWNAQHARGKDKASLTTAMFKAFGGMFCVAALFKLTQDIIAFLQPQLLKLLIKFSSDDNEPQWKGLSIAGVMLVTAVVQSICLHQYFHRVMKTGMRLRSAVIAAIYQKSLLLSTASRQASTSGEIVNLMSVDAQRFMDLMSYLHMLWSAPLQISLALYFLYDLMGSATFYGLAVLVLMIPLNGYLAKKSRDFQKLLMKEKDSRIKLMNEVLNGIRVLKLYAWEKTFGRYVSDIRDRELGILKSYAILNAGSSFTWTIAPFLVSLATFIAYTTKHELTPSVAFVSLSLFNLLRFPIAMLPMMISFMVEASISVKRVRDFLLLEERDPEAVIREERMLLDFPRNCPTPSDNADPPAFFIDRGTFSWGDEPILKDISFMVMPQSLCALVGRVGSGKTSVLSALNGEMARRSGRVVLPGSVSYVPQQAWIRNMTVRDNITFGKPFDADKYKRVVFACALVSDFKSLPGGDMTEIGEKGINLSGGQKQRISLARAVYQETDVYLLDDCLSAVDSHVGKHIFQHVIGRKGMLKDKTRILVTHALHVLPHVDWIVMMESGEIIEQNNYESLMSARGRFADLIDEFMTEQADLDNDLSEQADDEAAASDDEAAEQTLDEIIASAEPFDRGDEEASAAPAQGTAGAMKSINTSARDVGPIVDDDAEEDVDERKPLLDKNAAKASKKSGANNALITKEGAEEGSVKMDVYWRYIKAVGYFASFTVVFCYLLSMGAQVGSNEWLSFWSDANNTETHHRNYTVTTYLGVYGALGAGNAFLVLISSIALAYGSVHASRLLHDRMLHNILRSPMSFFDTTPMGRILNRFSKDIYVIDESIPRSFRSFMSTFMNVLGIIVVISVSTPIFMAAVLPMGALYYFIQRYYIASSRQLKRLESVSRSPIYSHFGETLSGVSSIVAYDKVLEFNEENKARINTNLESYYPSICANRWLALRLESIGNLIIFFAALFAVLDRDKISAGVVGLSLSYAMSVTQTLNWMVRMSSQLETDVVAVERIDEYCQLPSERDEITLVRPSANWPTAGKIDFVDYSVRYREGLDCVLRDISFSVESCEKIGIVGRTGAGKSSLTLALFRIIEAAAGSIVIDNMRTSDLGLHDLRNHLTIMPQDPVLFSGTIRRNLDPTQQHTDEAIWRALETCDLKATVKGLPNGLDSEVAEGGENFSVGQRQLICLGRAILRKTKILLLDEATAAVDMETDEFLQQTIRREFADCTILTIAHRINTIMDSDRILVLDQGRVAEFDTPQNLLADPSSIFYGMAAAAGLVNAVAQQARE
eukprot:m.12723 g.12723  ORF g.12723 m.12723 type:complete len:1556 (+) comp5858_c0_seq1:79-4746(+)